MRDETTKELTDTTNNARNSPVDKNNSDPASPSTLEDCSERVRGFSLSNESPGGGTDNAMITQDKNKAVSAEGGRFGSPRATGSSKDLLDPKNRTASPRFPRSPQEDNEGAMASLLGLIHENTVKTEAELESLEGSDSVSAAS